MAGCRAPPQWGWQLRVVARLGFYLRWVVPTDLEALLTCGHDASHIPGSRVSAAWLCVAFLAQSIKWPPSTLKFLSLLRSPGSSDLDVERAGNAGVLLEALSTTIAWSSDRDWPMMFSRMNDGLMDAQTGLAVSCQSIGLLCQDEAARKRAKSKSRAPEAADVDLPAGMDVALGPARRRYRLAQPGTKEHGIALEILENMLLLAQAAEIVWPAGQGDLSAFADAALDWAKQVRRYTCQGKGFHGGASTKHQYKAQSFTRALVLMAKEKAPTIDARVLMKDYLRWLPDQNKHLEPLEDKTAAYVEHKFGVSAPMVCCWACLTNYMPEADARSLLHAEDKNIMRVLDAHLQEAQSRPSDLEQMTDQQMGLFAPGPHPLWYALQNGG